jgi:NADP-dependent 3-hydroxy acid dehydrogenase YdfG
MTTMSKLKDKVVVITGGTSGVGKATALLAAEHGAIVITCGRHADKVRETEQALQNISAKSRVLVADVSKQDDIEKLFTIVEKEFGGVDILVNNAGIPANSILNTPISEWHNVLNVNLLGYMIASKYAIDLMKKRRHGHIVNIGSLGIRVEDNGADLYMAAKGGVKTFTNSIRKQVAKENIKVTLINPGAIGSGMVTETPKQVEKMVAEEKMLKPEDVAEAILYCITQSERIAVTELEVRPQHQSEL